MKIKEIRDEIIDCVDTAIEISSKSSKVEAVELKVIGYPSTVVHQMAKELKCNTIVKDGRLCFMFKPLSKGFLTIKVSSLPCSDLAKEALKNVN